MKLVKRNLEQLRGSYKKIGKFRLSETAAAIKQRMQTPGKKIRYPVQWVSLLQRMAFFASKGFGGGVPTIRKHVYERGWKTESTVDGAKVYNNTPGAKYIGGNMRGEGQSPIHRGRWILLRSAYDAVIKKLPKSVVESLRALPKRN
ncbi:MAG: hypothetical protein ABIO63_04120 [Casimicrobiaceae bacterium]